MGAQKFMGAQKLLRGHDASASLRHPQMAPASCHGRASSQLTMSQRKPTTTAVSQ